ncbi:glycosyltransferase [Vibrio breoganii]|uniref:glycosyltransferase n=1 Tax=Vibrio breoganii TaxID=553239 RepID=UPI00241141C0|nr:glycosyltransferase [Vibrio breoganii]
MNKCCAIKGLFLSTDRICLYLVSYSGGGAEREMIYLANEFSDRGFQVDLIVHRDSGPLKTLVSERVNSIIIDKNYISDLMFLCRYIRREQPRFVLSTLHLPNWTLALAKLLSFSDTKIFWRVVISLSNSRKDGKGLIPKFLSVGYPLLSNSVNRITCVSEGVAADMVDNFAINPNKLHVMYNPAYTQNIHHLAGEPVEHPWFGENYNTIVSMGRLSSQKDFKTLITGFYKVYKIDPSARLVILGDGALRDELQSLIDSCSLSDVVSLHGFELNPYKYLAKADLFVLSSIYEGFGNVIVEALALNVPVVSTDCPSGPSEILNNGEWGVLVPPSDPEQLADAIIRSLNQKIERDTLVRAQEFSVEAVVNKYIELTK